MTLWDLPSGKTSRAIPTGLKDIWRLGLSADGKTLAAATLKLREIVVFDATTGWQERLEFDGRVWAITADCPTRDLPTFRPWFDAALASLEIWRGAGH